MFRLLKLLFWLAALGAVLYFAATVPLGRHTLIGHLRAIWATDATQELVAGTKKEAERVAHDLRRELKPDGGAASDERASSDGATGEPLSTGQPADTHDAKDRHALDELIRARQSKH